LGFLYSVAECDQRLKNKNKKKLYISISSFSEPLGDGNEIAFSFILDLRVDRFDIKSSKENVNEKKKRKGMAKHNKKIIILISIKW